MNEAQPVSPESRLQNLESEIRRNKLRTLALAILLAGALGIVSWQLLTPKTVLRVQRLVLVNEDGFEVGELVATTAGGSLLLQTEDSMIAIVTAGELGAGLLIQDPIGPDISLLAGNQPYLYFGDASSGQAVLLGMDRGLRPRLQIKDGLEMLRFGRGDAGPGLSMSLKNSEGDVLWQAPE